MSLSAMGDPRGGRGVVWLAGDDSRGHVLEEFTQSVECVGLVVQLPEEPRAGSASMQRRRG